MKTFKSSLLLLIMAVALTACNEEMLIVEQDAPDNLLKMGIKTEKATGSVEILWKGAEKGSDMGNKPENLRAFFEFDAHENSIKTGPKGNVVFKVTTGDLTPHREIYARVLDVNIDSEASKGWFVARVISDSKGCNGTGGHSDHETGCSGEDHPDDGGCSDDTTHDDGCSDGHTADDGGCSDNHTTDDGGCSDDHTTDEGGCSDDHTTDEGGHKPDVTGSEGKGNPLSGKNCRTNQIIVVKVHDMATPGANGDGITWKWFASDYSYNIDLEPKHLCKKTIIAGNLSVK